METKIDGPFPGIPFGIFPSEEMANAALRSDISADLTTGLGDRPSPTPIAAGPDRASLLTPRERDVADLVVKGFSTKTIAEDLGIAASTVRTHRDHINQKTGTKNAVQLLHWLGG